MAASASSYDVGPTPSKRRDRGVEKKESAAPGASAIAKRPLAVAEETFSTDLLRVYYGRFFPYRPFYRWLSYSQDPAKGLPLANKGFMARREFSFTIENDIYIRYLSFGSESELIRGIQSRQPHKIDIGAVFTHPPCNKESTKKGAFRPVERELIFDIDLTDYDEIRTCCSGAAICHRCWPFMTVAIKTLDRGLREDFGFKHIFWVYSGRRGVHCWVCDKEARALANDGRTAVVEYFSAITGSMDKKAESIVSLTTPMHPSLERAFAELESMFVKVMAPGSGQGLLEDDATEQWEKVLQFVPATGDVREVIRRAWATPGNSPSQRWAQLKAAVRSARKATSAPGIRAALDKVVPTIVFAFTYPRIDVNVTKGTNHLLKSPFCVHPKTGRVCVPIVADDCAAFDPQQVPTIPRLVAEYDEYIRSGGSASASDDDDDDDDVDTEGAATAASASSASHGGAKTSRVLEAWKHTSLGEYMEKWERGFLRPMERDIASSMRRRAERLAAVTGDW